MFCHLPVMARNVRFTGYGQYPVMVRSPVRAIASDQTKPPSESRRAERH